MFKQFTKDMYSSLRKQHNILVLVGNGFDTAILNHYNAGKMKGKTSSYRDFYEYIRYYGLSNDDNILFERMTRDREAGKENWSDFELTINELFEENPSAVNEIEMCVDAFQSYFTRFLNDLVDADLLLSINSDVSEKKLAQQSLSRFLSDVDVNCNIKFPKNTGHYDLYNFVFANFNYTSLLDNYLYLDKNQFDPHYWASADRNFSFFPDLKNSSVNPPTQWSSYLVTDVIHPHGVQDIPRSILFGVDIPDYNKGKSPEKRIIKSYWAQYEVKYESYFNDAELFIIYGMSLAKTDGWWLDHIFDAILNRESEVIIYKYGNDRIETIKDMFILSCIRHQNATREEIEKVRKNIYVITFESNDTFFLGLEKKIK